nr:MAG TPA: hypothetical protein [Caudoviricetes sp.]
MVSCPGAVCQTAPGLLYRGISLYCYYIEVFLYCQGFSGNL